MKVDIIDPEHFEVAYTLIRLFHKQGHEVAVYTDEATHTQLLYLTARINGITWIVKPGSQSKRSFIRHCFRQIRQRKPDLLFLSSIPDNHLLFSWNLMFLRKIPVVLTIHNVNSYLLTPKSNGLKAWVRWAGKRTLFNRADAYHVLGDNIGTSLRSGSSTGKEIFVIPGGLYEGELGNELAADRTVNASGAAVIDDRSTANSKSVISIVVPGSVDSRRRDYQQVFDLLDLARDRRIQVHVTLLGAFSKEHSENIRARLQQYVNDGHDLTVYGNDVIHQRDFDMIMEQAAFIWMPVMQKIIIRDGIMEAYGLTTSSGNVGDAIRFARPILVARFLKLDEPLRKQATVYETIAELGSFLGRLNPDHYSYLVEQARIASHCYTPDMITERNIGLIRDLLIRPACNQ